MSPNETKIFINYAREDASFAQRIYFDLKQLGYDVWLDTSDLKAGENWKQAIQRAIKQSNFIISLLSSNSITKKGYVQKELKICFEILDEFPSGSIYIIPVRLNDCEVIEETIRQLNWVDIFESYSKGLYRILKSLSPDFALSFSEVRDLLYKSNRRPEIRFDGVYVNDEMVDWEDGDSIGKDLFHTYLHFLSSGEVYVSQLTNQSIENFAHDIVHIRSSPFDTLIVPYKKFGSVHSVVVEFVAHRPHGSFFYEGEVINDRIVGKLRAKHPVTKNSMFEKDFIFYFNQIG
jgi:hypothetical protein